MAVANTKQFTNALDKTIDKQFFDIYDSWRSEYDSLFKSETAPKGNSVTESEITGLGALRTVAEGQGVEFDTPVEGNKKTRYYSKYGLGFQGTEEMFQDDLFGNLVKQAGAIARSARYTTEYMAFYPFNNAFASTNYSGWDGLGLVVNNHSTLKSGTTINNLGTGDLCSTTLQAAFQYYDVLVDEAGLPIVERPAVLLGGTDTKWIANELLKNTGRVWDYGSYSAGYDYGSVSFQNKGIVSDASAYHVLPTNTGIPNRFNPSNGIVDGWRVHISRFLTSTDDWFLLGENFDGKILWKKKPSIETSTDFTTGNKLWKVTMRLLTSVNNYKSIYGSQG